MGSPTQWSNADNKTPSQWSNVTKTPTDWNGDNERTPTGWTPQTKNPTLFTPNKSGRIAYHYSDPNIKYTDPLRGYTYMQTVKSGTTWSPIV